MYITFGWYAMWYVQNHSNIFWTNLIVQKKWGEMLNSMSFKIS